MNYQCRLREKIVSLNTRACLLLIILICFKSHRCDAVIYDFSENYDRIVQENLLWNLERYLSQLPPNVPVKEKASVMF